MFYGWLVMGLKVPSNELRNIRGERDININTSIHIRYIGLYSIYIQYLYIPQWRQRDWHSPPTVLRQTWGPSRVFSFLSSLMNYLITTHSLIQFIASTYSFPPILFPSFCLYLQPLVVSWSLVAQRRQVRHSCMGHVMWVVWCHSPSPTLIP